MNSPNRTIRLFIIVLLSFVTQGLFGQSWNPLYSIGVNGGKYAYDYNTTPNSLIELYSPSPLNVPDESLYTFQWQSSPVPLDIPVGSFTNISGATSNQFTFTAPLSQTTYYRCIVSDGTYTLYSNTIRIEVVSINWENHDYTRQHTILIPGQTDWKAIDALPIGTSGKLQTTNYTDGLGRSMERISKGTATPAAGSSLWGDMVQFSVFDEYGRQSKQYLPYTTTSTTESGKFKGSPITDQASYYTNSLNETSPFSEVTLYDNSPLNRARTVKSPGASWAAGNGNQAAYDMNDISEGVRLFRYYSDASLTTPDYVSCSELYPTNSLYKTTHTDENGKLVIEYANKAGQLILKKVQIDDSPGTQHNGWICTYYVYDDFGLLRFQVSPKGVDYLDGDGWVDNISFQSGSVTSTISGTTTTTNTNLDGLVFYYQYDEKGRCIVKKTPDAKQLNMVYDNRDRVVFMQDGNQAAIPQWTANLYDELDRPIITALYNTSNTVAQLQTAISGSLSTITSTTVTNPAKALTDLVVTTRNTTIQTYSASNSIEFIDGFESGTSDAFETNIATGAMSPATSSTVSTYNSPISPTSLNDATVCTILKYQFYDDYTFAGAKPFSSNFNNTQAYATSSTVLAITPSVRTISFPTGSRVRILNTTSFLNTTQYYDDDGQPIQTLEENMKDGTDITTNQYAFDGRLLSTYSSHTTVGTGYSDFGTLTKNLFDNIGRVTSIQKQFGGNKYQTIANYTYDDMGRLQNKTLDPNFNNPTTGNNFLESLAYSYNIHNQLVGINKDYAQKTAGTYNKWGNYFGMFLGFDANNEPDPNHPLFASHQLNGQVNGTLWNTQGDDEQRKYDFSYDNAGRLSNAAFKQLDPSSATWGNGKLDFSVSGQNGSGNIQYDLNGNILYMSQRGVVAGGSAPTTIDDLAYTYKSYSNQLIKVTDANTAATNGSAGDFKDGTNTGNDYTYDDNGNLLLDMNKGINNITGATTTTITDASGNAVSAGILYNYLDKPCQINIPNKGTVYIVYDATGSRLQKIFTPAPPSGGWGAGGGASHITTYINEFVYEESKVLTTGTNVSLGGGGAVSYINFEEGRIRVISPFSSTTTFNNLAVDNEQVSGSIALPIGSGTLDYFIRDYQANVRMILTEESHSSYGTCTMETGRAGSEDPIFGQVGTGNEVEKTRVATSSITGFDWTNNTIGSSVSKVGKLAASRIGPNSLLKVMAGDEITATSLYYFNHPAVNSGSSSAATTDLVTSVIGSLTQVLSTSGAVNTAMQGQATNITSPLNSNNPFGVAVLPDAAATDNLPKAYLSVLFFDERFNFVGSEPVHSDRVKVEGNNTDILSITGIKAPKNGYAYIYVSNESDEPVYFDNLKVSHTRGSIVEENHYYAYGLKIAAISSHVLPAANEGNTKNNYLYQGDFSQFDEEVGWNDFELRNYDPQIGRWIQQDPYDQYESPYVGMGNDPVNGVDPDGGLGVNLGTITLLGRIAVTAGGAAAGYLIDKNNGGNGWDGAVIGGAIALGATFIPPFSVDAAIKGVGGTTEKIVSAGVQVADVAANVVELNIHQQEIVKQLPTPTIPAPSTPTSLSGSANISINNPPTSNNSPRGNNTPHTQIPKLQLPAKPNSPPSKYVPKTQSASVDNSKKIIEKITSIAQKIDRGSLVIESTKFYFKYGKKAVEIFKKYKVVKVLTKVTGLASIYDEGVKASEAAHDKKPLLAIYHSLNAGAQVLFLFDGGEAIEFWWNLSNVVIDENLPEKK